VTDDTTRDGHTPPSTSSDAAMAVRLLDDPATADLSAKVATAWRDFTAALAAALGKLPRGARLDLILDPAASGTGDAVYDVSIGVDENGDLEADAVSNAALPVGYRLDRAAVASLIALGWSPPGVVAGSGDRFGLRAPASEAARIAALVGRTMRDVYGTPHPAFLTYTAQKVDEIPPLATARPLNRDEVVISAEKWEPDPHTSLTERVKAVVAHMQKTTPESLNVDSDGDIGIRAGSAMVFVRIHRNPPLVDVYSPILTEVIPNERLYERLSQLTRRMPIGRLYYTEGTVWASVPVFGRDFQPSHLILAIQVMTTLADELDDRLQGDFGGRRFFGENDKPSQIPQERTGMYL